MKTRLHRISTSTAAKAAIADQYDFYADRQGVELADRWEIAVAESLQSLRTMSDRGTPCQFRNKRLKDIRWFATPVFPFRIFYRLDENSGIVRVLHILHEKRDVEKTLLKSAQQ
jgi:plasmid stabilization system protein ParE